MSKMTDLLKAWTGGTLGGSGANLSAVDEDITLVNSHQVQLSDTPENAANVGIYYDPGSGALMVEGNEANYGATPLQIIAPGGGPSGPGGSIAMVADSGSPEIRFGMGTNHAALAMEGSNLLAAPDIRYTLAHGPILGAPDGSTWRIVVANNGTLSTELVQAA